MGSGPFNQTSNMLSSGADAFLRVLMQLKQQKIQQQQLEAQGQARALDMFGTGQGMRGKVPPEILAQLMSGPMKKLGLQLPGAPGGFGTPPIAPGGTQQPNPLMSLFGPLPKEPVAPPTLDYNEIADMATSLGSENAQQFISKDERFKDIKLGKTPREIEAAGAKENRSFKRISLLQRLVTERIKLAGSVGADTVNSAIDDFNAISDAMGQQPIDQNELDTALNQLATPDFQPLAPGYKEQGAAAETERKATKTAAEIEATKAKTGAYVKKTDANIATGQKKVELIKRGQDTGLAKAAADRAARLKIAGQAQAGQTARTQAQINARAAEAAKSRAFKANEASTSRKFKAGQDAKYKKQPGAIGGVKETEIATALGNAVSKGMSGASTAALLRARLRDAGVAPAKIEQKVRDYMNRYYWALKKGK